MSKENAVLERKDELFVHFKAYDTELASDFGNLKVSSDEFRAVIDIFLTVFEKEIKEMICKKNVTKTIFNMCESEVKKAYPYWFM